MIRDELELVDPFSVPPYQKTGETVVRFTTFYSYTEERRSGLVVYYHLKQAYIPECRSTEEVQEIMRGVWDGLFRF